jgi:hypothetical protein
MTYAVLAKAKLPHRNRLQKEAIEAGHHSPDIEAVARDIALRFDPLKFVDADLSPDVVWVDIDLLRSGSAVAVLASLYDLWCEVEAVDVPHRNRLQKEAIEAGRLHHSPDIEAVAREALRRDRMPLEDPWFEEVVQPIYRKHVLGYFRRLSEMDRKDA